MIILVRELIYKNNWVDPFTQFTGIKHFILFILCAISALLSVVEKHSILEESQFEQRTLPGKKSPITLKYVFIVPVREIISGSSTIGSGEISIRTALGKGLATGTDFC